MDRRAFLQSATLAAATGAATAGAATEAAADLHSVTKSVENKVHDLTHPNEAKPAAA